MPEPMEFTIEADEQPAVSSLDRVRSKFTQVERAAIDTFRRMTGAADSFARGVVRIAEASGALLLARQAFRDMRESFTGTASAADRENGILEKTLDLYRGLRVATVALTGSRAALAVTSAGLAIGLGIEEAIRITRRYGKELLDVSIQAAKSKAEVQSVFAIDRAGAIIGQDLSKFAKFPVVDLRNYIVELRGIEDPLLRAIRAQEVFGEASGDAMRLAERSTERALDRGIELAASLNGEQRIAIENARRAFASFGGILGDIGQGLRTLREQAKQAIVVRVSAIVDFVGKGGIGQKLGGGFGEGGEAGIGTAGFQNPNPNIVPSLAEILQGAVSRESGERVALPATAGDVRGIQATAAERALLEEGRRAVSSVREFESTLDGLREKLQQARRRRDTLFATVQQGGNAPALFGGSALAASREVAILESRIDAIEKTEAAERRAADILQQAKRQEFTGLAAIVAEYQLYRQELGLSAKANRDLAEAARIRLQAEAQKELRKNSATVVQDNAEALRLSVQFDTQRFQRELQFNAETLELAQRTARERLNFEDELVRDSRDSQIRQLELIGNETVQQKVQTEQRRGQIEEDYLLRSFARKAAALDRELQLELTNMEAIYRARGISEEAIAARRSEIVQASAERGRQLEATTQGAIDAARESASIRSTRVVVEAQQRAYRDLQRQVEGAFDGLLARGKTAGEKLRDLILLPLFAGVKKLAVDFTTRLLAPIFGVAGGGQAAAGGGFGRLLGLGGVAALGGGGGIGFPGAPGGTPGFAGPVGLGAGSGGVGGIGGALAGSAASLKGILTQLGGLGRGVGTGSALAGRGVGGTAGGALLAGGGILAFDGLRRGGALGLAETTAGGALIGFKFGGPLGAAIGASIGAVAGTIRLFVKGAQEKIVEKVKNVYGVTITKNFARDPLLGIIKQGFGGNIDVGIRSAQVRDLIELYAMSTGQNSAGINTTRPITSSFSLSGGSLSQQPVFQNGLSLGVGQSSSASPATTVIQLDPGATEAFLQGQAVQAMGANPRAVQGAVLSASRQNAGRRQGLALAVNPGLMVS